MKAADRVLRTRFAHMLYIFCTDLLRQFVQHYRLQTTRPTFLTKRYSIVHIQALISWSQDSSTFQAPWNPPSTLLEDLTQFCQGERLEMWIFRMSPCATVRWQDVSVTMVAVCETTALVSWWVCNWG